MTKQEYFAIKKYLASICYKSFIELCSNVGLNEYETSLAYAINQDKTRTAMCIKFGFCEATCTKELKKVLAKINDYRKKTNLF